MPGRLDRLVETLDIILLAFVLMQTQRKVPLSFAFGERVRDDMGSVAGRRANWGQTGRFPVFLNHEGQKRRTGMSDPHGSVWLTGACLTHTGVSDPHGVAGCAGFRS